MGFVFEADGVRMAIATDLGYMPPNVKMAIRNCDVLMLESNHDLEMLRDGPYPWSVKQRVMSRVGHLSNEAASEFLRRITMETLLMSYWRIYQNVTTCLNWHELRQKGR